MVSTLRFLAVQAGPCESEPAKRLRGRHSATYRLRVGEFRVFYDVAQTQVIVVAVLHKRDTAAFYQEEGS
jgi:mRNA-degrading endonuclease RelE of RelBE toxin-antitoxin system